jgi:RNA polymerase sigma factor (sigma-70 family)
MPSDDIPLIVEHLFRREYGRLVALLTHRFGVEHIDLAEEMVQDALVKAVQIWPFSGVPRNPSAWILQTARNRALDHTRRHQVWRGKQPVLTPFVEECLETALATPEPRFEEEIRDSQLRMMFVCCDPRLNAEVQVAMTLKLLGGLGELELAAAFLVSEAAIAKRITRARDFLREQKIRIELPPAETLAERVQSVRQVLYLIFNEGYKASSGDSLLRADLCAEALRLGELLIRHPCGTDSITHALLALMHLNAARLPARIDDSGGLLLLAEQDRSRWNQARLRAGFAHFESAACGGTLSSFHLEAAIAACHCAAADFAQTDWARILSLYDDLLIFDPSPITALNRTVVLSRVKGPPAALQALRKIASANGMAQYYLFHAIEGQLLIEAGQSGAERCFRRALQLATVPAERELLNRRIDALRAL